MNKTTKELAIVENTTPLVMGGVSSNPLVARVLAISLD